MTECNDGLNTLETSNEEANIMRFAEAVMKDKDLEFIGGDVSTNAEPIITEDDEKYDTDTMFVLRDSRKDEGSNGAFPKIKVQEVIEKCLDNDRAEQIVTTLKGERAPIVLHGITRIVGYYSRVNNWNKSKVGELRDRAQRNYGLTMESPKFDAERMQAINSL